MNFDYQRLYLSAEGRIGRGQYWLGAIVLGVATAIVGWILLLILGVGLIGRLIEFVLQVIVAYPAYNLMAKRFQDRDKPAMYAAIIIAIFLVMNLLTAFGITGDPMAPNAFSWIFGLITLAIAIWALVELGILRGTVGQNQYGPDPLGGS